MSGGKKCMSSCFSVARGYTTIITDFEKTSKFSEIAGIPFKSEGISV